MLFLAALLVDGALVDSYFMPADGPDLDFE